MRSGFVGHDIYESDQRNLNAVVGEGISRLSAGGREDAFADDPQCSENVDQAKRVCYEQWFPPFNCVYTEHVFQRKSSMALVSLDSSDLQVILKKKTFLSARKENEKNCERLTLEN